MKETVQESKTLGRFTFKKPVPYIIREFIDDEEEIRFCVENKELGTIGCGSTIENALIRFEGHMIAGMFLWHKCKTNKKINLSPTSICMMERWKDYLNFDEYSVDWLIDEMDRIDP
jgi:hypothetical protein